MFGSFPTLNVLLTILRGIRISDFCILTDSDLLTATYVSEDLTTDLYNVFEALISVLNIYYTKLQVILLAEIF